MSNIVFRETDKLDKIIKQKFSGKGFNSSHAIDLFLKWLPILVCLAIHSKENRSYKRKIGILIMSQVLMNCMVEPLKKITKRKRPGLFSKHNSFPSRHTAVSFMGAEIMHEETKKEFPFVSLTGYTIASTTGVLRIYNKKHWFSDVLAGAVIGIYSAKLAFFLHKKVFDNQKN
jgi:membrane-associated phospholipid phosphatase